MAESLLKTDHHARAGAESATSRKRPGPTTPAGLFNEALVRINEAFKPGTLELIADERPGMAAEIDQALEHLENEWRKAGPFASAGFRAALRVWFDRVILAIEYCKGRVDE